MGVYKRDHNGDSEHLPAQESEDTILIEEENTIYELDRLCVVRRKNKCAEKEHAAKQQ